MHVGRSVFFQNLDGGVSDQEVISNEMSLLESAEQSGFESLWVAEHHFGGYHMCPSPLQILTYLAGRTREVLLGTMVVVLPWHEPIRVAEEVAMLDHLSGGRVVLGIGRGLGRLEFDGFRLNQGESRERFAEYAETVVEAFDTGYLEHSGKFLSQPRVELRPKPRASLRGRVYASAISPESMEIMARLGFGIMVIAQKPWKVTIAEIAEYRNRYIEINGEEPPRPLLVTFVNVHESEQAATELHDRYTLRYAESCLDHYEFDNADLAKIPGYEYYGRLAASIATNGPEQFTRFLADLQVRGTPEQVIEQMTENVRQLDAAGSIAVLSFGGMPLDVATANQELFVRSVLPQLQAIDTDRQLAGPKALSR
ncbi:MAG TPA: LLM class flavin-dependent oxidoreductase [Acidimicrobiales bacterium]|jgi:alkanesulfonate monooxygenase SsuD/methylene tetrahydromethanopterin reductase-like flavin-dependent oxidoreductase (luciferase family)|nr:LLM class flavin-dependent oxidoreductase [Acidimicrobiales bacterium]